MIKEHHEIQLDERERNHDKNLVEIDETIQGHFDEMLNGIESDLFEHSISRGQLLFLVMNKIEIELLREDSKQLNSVAMRKAV